MFKTMIIQTENKIKITIQINIIYIDLTHIVIVPLQNKKNVYQKEPHEKYARDEIRDNKTNERKSRKIKVNITCEQNISNQYVILLNII